MVATTKTQLPDCQFEDNEFDPATSANYCVAWRIRCQNAWNRQYFANRFEAHRRYLELVAKVSEICLYVPCESP
ncbi:hypothetical protein [Anatilimnocola floriformis]|uniref:hypothetical protein n=1 Tax=Anatilimnocola floriformis TaxID=2948575 RepID=UPI0020C2ECBB|nr:hypothetical protein [Anatilimnocola floriformis]